MDYREEFLSTLDNVTIYTNSAVKIDLEDLKRFFKNARIEGRKIFFIGNGGSTAIAEHMTVDYLKNGRMHTVNLFAAATLTCLSNDFGYEHVFSKQLEFMAQSGDILVAISSSGNSPNIVNAVNKARELKMKILTLSGFDPDNKISKAGDYNLHVPSHRYGIVESIHNLILQQILDEINAEEVN